MTLSSNPRPTSRASGRPVSSLSQYPSGSAQSISSLTRPASSSSVRPVSQASHRPKSRQQRIASARLFPLCQALVRNVFADGDTKGEPSKNFEDDSRETVYNNCVDYALKTLGVESSIKAAITFDMESIERMVHGHVEKARIKSSETLATALEESFEKLKVISEQEHDLDSEIKKSSLPSHIQFLLALSSPPTPSTLTYASLYLNEQRNPHPSPESDALTWKKILEEDPYEGEHWIGVPGGLPLPGQKKRRIGDDDLSDLDLDSSPSLSPLNSDDLELNDVDPERSPNLTHEEQPSLPQDPGFEEFVTEEKPLHTTYAYRTEVESLRKKQYWQEDWRMDPEITIQTRGSFDIGVASTLGPTLQRVLPNGSSSASSSSDNPFEILVTSERYIHEQDAVREILMALQGLENTMLELKDGQYTTTRNTPRLLHLSLAAQYSMLQTLGHSCSTIQKLRNFITFVTHFSTRSSLTSGPLPRLRTSGKMTHTLEAFADAIDTEIRGLDCWCANQEEAWLRALGGGLSDSTTSESIFGQPGLVVSLLGIEKAFRDRFEHTFQVLLEVIHEIISESETGIWSIPVRSPSVTTSLLLDRLFFTVQQRLERGDSVTADAVMRVFVRSAEPVWDMIGKWLGKGFNLNGERLEEEFFIQSNGIGLEIGVLGLLDPDFWTDGYYLRDDDSEVLSPGDSDEQLHKSIPCFLRHVATPILQSGKAIGLLKTLDKDVGEGSETSMFRDWDWGSFRSLLTSDLSGDISAVHIPHEDLTAPREVEDLYSVSIGSLEQLIFEKVEPYRLAGGRLLADVVVEECDFWFHLHAMESLYLMRKGDVISDFADGLFSKMDARQDWSDFHFLNTSFGDIVELSNTIGGSKPWVQLSLVRLFYRGDMSKKHSIARTVRAIDGLFLEYAVPFPLTYIFTRQNLQVYDQIFGFLLQIRRAKNVLEKCLARGQDRKTRDRPGLKEFYAMRSRLSWFINTLLNFLTTYVIHTQILKFHDTLKTANSLSFDEMIGLHHEHLGMMQGRCLLQTKTLPLHRAIISILDMSISFSDVFAAFTGDSDVTHDVSSRSLVIKRQRSRRQRRRRRNVVGFSQSIDWGSGSSDSEEFTADVDEIGPEADVSKYDGPTSSFSIEIGETEMGDLDPFSRITKMSTELDGLVKSVQKGVETLAGGTDDEAPAFGVLAFLLEDWDLF
ncbi:hypothetical protein K435DRAFT_4268 [Dendrothele bispora CBS 962.96]|uniref:Spindle pole body component n=1 Tax=Dendrothele bispora (strain CBS 962.96) TaxID=1314807 RepID=A0A4S8MXU7_DENBC|nr:hypothetical protein K435DRAFT_4268 [Dendrothele bispora CBS 962.96]